ncbi:uncharacterized protein LOC125766889 [Anopheles funestus]|uniref:uncharacterized protein LOC125766889 n=1 Tax=Anopheles funestus TaxID=62324 RepID=UPI0020C5B8B7|nr:uncharacterized protein LOC125766889 [Anopheles funestus]
MGVVPREVALPVSFVGTVTCCRYCHFHLCLVPVRFGVLPCKLPKRKGIITCRKNAAPTYHYGGVGEAAVSSHHVSDHFDHNAFSADMPDHRTAGDDETGFDDAEGVDDQSRSTDVSRTDEPDTEFGVQKPPQYNDVRQHAQ